MRKRTGVYQESMQSRASLDGTVVIQRNRRTMKSAESIDLDETRSYGHPVPVRIGASYLFDSNGFVSVDQMTLNAAFVEEHFHSHEKRAVIEIFNLLNLRLSFVGVFQCFFQAAGEHRMENG